MLKIFFYDAIRWRDLLNAISTLREEVEFKISPERMQLRAMDDSHTAMVDMDLSKDFFDKYQCDKSTDLRFNLNSVLNILQGVTSNESIAMMYDEEQARITINLRGEYERIFNLTTLSVEKEFEREPKGTFKVKAQLQTPSLKKVITDSQKMGDQIVIKSDSESITFHTIGLSGNVLSTFQVGEAPIVNLSVSVDSEATYNLDLLGTIIKNVAAISDVTNLDYSTNQVLRLGLVFPKGKLTFYLSPMLETD